jgi:DNA sulfur modification protein DndD
LLKELERSQIGIVERELKVAFERYIEELSDGKEEDLLHDLSTTDSGKLEFILTGVRNESETRLRDLLQEREKVNIEINALYSRLKGVSDEAIDTELTRLGEIRSEIGKLQHELGMVNERRNRLEVDLLKKNEEKAALEEKLECADEDRIKMELIQRTVDLLTQYKQLQISRRIDELERLVTKHYRQLANKGDMVSRIEISEEDFEITLINRRGSVLERETISAGEQEIFAIAVIWGLAEMTGHELPMIIDTPLAKLDSRHVSAIAKKFFPAASHQVILLSQDREIDAKLYSSLKKNIDHALTISLGEKDKIREGYFFDQKTNGLGKQAQAIEGYI